MTLRKFTAKQLNGKRPDDQETAAEKYTNGLLIAPANRYAMVVDGYFETQFSE